MSQKPPMTDCSKEANHDEADDDALRPQASQELRLPSTTFPFDSIFDADNNNAPGLLTPNRFEEQVELQSMVRSPRPHIRFSPTSAYRQEIQSRSAKKKIDRLTQLSHVISLLEVRETSNAPFDFICSHLESIFGDTHLSRNILSHLLQGEVLIFNESNTHNITRWFAALSSRSTLARKQQLKAMKQAFELAQTSSTFRSIDVTNTLFIGELSFAVYQRRSKQTAYTVGSRFPHQMSMFVAISVANGCISMECVPGSPQQTNINAFVLEIVQKAKLSSSTNNPITIAMPIKRQRDVCFTETSCNVIGITKEDEFANIAAVLLQLFARSLKNEYGQFRLGKFHSDAHKDPIASLTATILEAWTSFPVNQLLSALRTQ